MRDPRDLRELLRQRGPLGSGAPIVAEKPDVIEVVSTRQPAEQPKMIGGLSVPPDPDDYSGMAPYLEKAKGREEKRRAGEKAETDRLAETMRQADEFLARKGKRNAESHKKAEAEKLVAEQRHAEYMASPEGRAAGERGRLNIDFQGSRPARQAIVSNEGQPKVKRKGILGLGILDI